MQIGLEFKRPPLLFLNTYQLNSNRKFSGPAVEKIIEQVLDAHLPNHKYNDQVFRFTFISNYQFTRINITTTNTARCLFEVIVLKDFTVAGVQRKSSS